MACMRNHRDGGNGLHGGRGMGGERIMNMLHEIQEIYRPEGGCTLTSLPLPLP